MRNLIRTFHHMDSLTKSYDAVDSYWDLGLQAYNVFHVIDEVKANGYYHAAYKLQCGAILNMSSRKSQGCKIEFGGQALEYVRQETKWSDETLLKILATPAHKRTTRLDYCFNCDGVGRAYELRRYIDSGKYRGRLQPAPSTNTPGKRTGETIMFGSKESDFRIRVYDKGAEMGELWGAFVRIEAQFRGEYAQNIAQDSFEGVTLADHAHTKITGATKDIDLKWWRWALTGKKALTRKIKRKQTAFEARMAQLMDEIVTKAEKSPEQREYIENEWLLDLVEKLNFHRKVAKNNTTPL